MALSEHEQRMLDAIEQQLFKDDPRFASSVDPVRIRRRRPIIAVTLFVIGVVALVVGAIATQRTMAVGVTVSVVGFMTMVAGVTLFFYGLPGSAGVGPGSASGSKTPSSLSQRMEDRLRRRFE